MQSVYKDYLISTIVDITHDEERPLVYKDYLISTIVDYLKNNNKMKGL